MQIIWHGESKIEIKTKSAVITTGDVVKINEVELPGPGEYEVAGVEAFGIDKDIYLFKADDIHVVYLDSINRSLTDDEIERLSEVEVLIIPIGGDKVINSKQASLIIKAVDPKIIIPVSYKDSKDFCADLGGCQDPVDDYRVLKAQLAIMEGQNVILLNSK